MSEMFGLQTCVHHWLDSCSHIFLWELAPVGVASHRSKSASGHLQRNLLDSSMQDSADTMLKGTEIMNFLPKGY